METLADLYEALGGPAAVGRIIGVSTEHAGVMRRRGSIPIEHWPALVDYARLAEMPGVDHETLTNLHIAEKRQRHERANRASAATAEAHA